MKESDSAVEIICNARWLASICLEIEPEIQKKYPVDIVAAHEVLDTLCTSMSHIETPVQIPKCCVDLVCSGVLYLLVAEYLFGTAPPTMHQFLQQTATQRRQSARQAQMLAVRWFVSSNILSLQELMDVVFAPGTTVEEFSSDYEAQMDVAKYLAGTDPFFYAAHSIIQRALLLKYCTNLVTIDDVINHTLLLVAESNVTIHTLEDALLFWVRSVIAQIGGLNTEFSHLDDLYLHTNDGRALSLVIHQYRPDLLPVSEVHLAPPLTVWQRQENWSGVIQAAEAMSLFVGVFADELVSHGFSTLQMHVLRVVVELFTVLAGNLETTYEDMSMELEHITEFIKTNDGISRSMGSRSFQQSTNFVAVTPGGASDVLNSGVDVAQRAKADPALCDESGEVEEEEEVESEEEEDKKGKGANSDDVAEHEFNAVLTGLFLQGVSAPIHHKEITEVDMPQAQPVVIQPAIECIDETTFSIHHEPQNQDQDHSHIVGEHGASQHPSPLAQQKHLESTNNDVVEGPTSLPHSSTKETHSSGTTKANGEPVRSTSPDVVSRSTEKLKRAAEFEYHRANRNVVMTSVAHFQRMRLDEAKVGAGEGRKRVGGSSLVQGSIDSDGIESLLNELSSVAQLPSVAPRVATAEKENLKEQNLKLRWALEEQQRRIGNVVKQLRKGIRKHEFNVIMKHLKKGKKAAAASSNSNSAVVASPTPQDPVRVSFAKLPCREIQEKEQQQQQQVVKALDEEQHHHQFESSPVAHSPAVTEASKIAPSSVEEAQQRKNVQLQLGKPAEAAEAEAATGGVAFNVQLGNLPKSKAALENLPHLSITQLQKLKERKRENVPRVRSLAPLSGDLPPLKSRNNRTVILNALKYVCLTGPVNKPNLDKVLEVIGLHDESEPAQFIVLLKDEFTHLFKGLYVAKGDGWLTRMFGSGPTRVFVGQEGSPDPDSSQQVFPKFFKFDTGSKMFTLLPSKWVNQMTDGVAFGRVPK